MSEPRQRPRLVVTGGLGRVARVVLPPLREAYRIHVLDHEEPGGDHDYDQTSTGDLRDPEVLHHAMASADAVLHLAANASPRSTWSTAMDNLTMAHHVLAAAARHDVPTVVLASSVHAAGGDFRAGETPVRTDRRARPCCSYGVAKAAMEAAATAHHDTTGASVSSIRFGLTGWPLTNRQFADTWFGDADAAALVRAALTAPAHIGIYHGVSRHGATLWDVTNAAADLGWEPTLDLPIPLADLPPATEAHCRLFDVPTSTGSKREPS